MNLDQIETKCFILALFIRDDGERFLLGSRAYEFIDSQLHFVANSYQNDIVEVQGNDGIMLAGQVRRGTSQPFDGYIGDQTVDRTTIEQYRRDFMKFFRKNHYYKVVYVFPDGSAVQRRNGFIVEAPEVKELYQLFPQYHISMNFEDINYYVYEEDSEGEEIYGESAILKIATSATGGLIWEEGTESEISGEGSQFTLQDTIDGNVLDSVQLNGDTTQQTYSGKNLVNLATFEKGRIDSGVIAYAADTSNITVSGDSLSFTTTKDNRGILSAIIAVSPSTPYTFSGVSTTVDYRYVDYYDNNGNWLSRQGGSSAFSDLTVTTPNNCYGIRLSFRLASAGTGTLTNMQFEQGSTATSYEPYVGGIPAPNPDYPQTVNTVTGRQVVTISDGDQQSQEYEVNLGKNLFDKDNATIISNYFISGNGSLTASNGFNVIVTPCEPNTTYTMSWMELAPSESNRCRIATSSTAITTSSTGMDIVANYTTGYRSPLTFTTPTNAHYIGIDIMSSTTTAMDDILSSIQLEKGSSATTYAPYISHFGKNMLDMNLTENGGINANGANAVAADNWRTAGYINAEPNTAYTYSVNGTLSQGYVLRFYQYDANYNFISPRTEGINDTITVTTGANTRYIRLVLYSNVGTMTKKIAEGAKLMLEQSSTATPYQQFIGGQLELCKIGDYQDYIYKSGDDWYVHKAIGKYTFSGTESWATATVSGEFVGYTTAITDYATSNNTPLSSYFSGASNVNSYGAVPYNSICFINISGSTTPRFYVRYGGIFANASRLTTFMTNNTPSIYYGLETPTDTQITDSSLVAQLEALLGATTYDGQTVFTVSSPNQLAILDVTVIARTGGGVVWDNYGAEWEEGTGGGPTMVNVDSIDNVYPVLTLTGPAVNPQISVLTTNTTLSYSGTVTSSQELKIDMFNKTATLNGASVVGNVSGDWVYLKPGVNRITYTTNNADAPDSTIWWQEIVG